MVKFMFSFLLCIWMPLVLLNLHTLAGAGGDTRDSGRDNSNKSPYSLDVAVDHAREEPGVPKIHHVVYASHRGSDDRFCRTVESAARHNITLNILGWGVAWGGLYQKLEATLQFCESQPPNDIVLFTDAFDVMFLKTSEEILEDYIAMETDILFGAECGCWPHVTRDGGRECLERYPASPTPYRYLNSGTWMARARAIVRVLTALKNRSGEGFAKSETNDQELVADMFLEGGWGINLDYNSKIFMSMHSTHDPPLAVCEPMKDIRVDSGKITNTRTGTSPAVLHFNGGGKQHHLDIDAQLWFRRGEFNDKGSMQALRDFQFIGPDWKILSMGGICGDYMDQLRRP